MHNVVPEVSYEHPLPDQYRHNLVFYLTLDLNIHSEWVVENEDVLLFLASCLGDHDLVLKLLDIGTQEVTIR